MQDRYVGDIGDYAKYSLLRALAHDCKLAACAAENRSGYL